jgi:hypothetical protein
MRETNVHPALSSIDPCADRAQWQCTTISTYHGSYCERLLLLGEEPRPGSFPPRQGPRGAHFVSDWCGDNNPTSNFARGVGQESGRKVRILPQFVRSQPFALYTLRPVCSRSKRISSVDGVQVGGIRTKTANHAQGQSEAVVLPGPYAPRPHTVTVTFLNDAYGGNSSTDRNRHRPPRGHLPWRLAVHQRQRDLQHRICPRWRTQRTLSRQGRLVASGGAGIVSHGEPPACHASAWKCSARSTATSFSADLATRCVPRPARIWPCSDAWGANRRSFHLFSSEQAHYCSGVEPAEPVLPWRLACPRPPLTQSC